MWHFTHRLNWQPGKEGKGSVYEDDEVETWSIDEDGDPHHQEVANMTGKTPVFLFYITPNGGVNDGGIGYSNRSSRTDRDMVSYITEMDGTLHEAEGDFALSEAAPRFESDSGFGHAYNVLDKLGSEQEIVDELRSWLDSFSAPSTEVEPLTPHHDDVMDIIPSQSEQASYGSPLDPPAHPYKPYDWAQEGDSSDAQSGHAAT